MNTEAGLPEFADYPLFVNQAAELLGYHVQYVRFLAKKGKIPAVKILGKWRFSETELREHLISFENSPVLKVKPETNF